MDFSAFTQLDWAVAAVIGCSALLGMWRGVVKEVISVAGWIVGGLLAFRYASEIGAHIPFDAFGEIGRTLAGGALILILTFIAFAVVGACVRAVLKLVSAGMGDAVLGILFGLLRGVLIIEAIVFAASFTSFPETQTWQKSVTIPYAVKGLELCRPFMSDSLLSLEKLARENQEAAKALWNEKFKL